MKSNLLTIIGLGVAFFALNAAPANADPVLKTRPRPDLVVASVNVNATSATIKNTSALVGAGPSTVKFELLKCSDNSVIAAGKAGPLAVAKGASVTFVPVMTKPVSPPPSYWRVTADFDKQVSES